MGAREVWPPGRRWAQGRAGETVQRMGFHEKGSPFWRVRVSEREESAPTTRASGGASAMVPPGPGGAPDPGIGPLWLCPHVLQAGAEPASGLDPGTRRS